jgi:hypothetical protein
VVTTTGPVSTTLPKVTTTLPVSTTLPKVTTTPPVSTTLPKVTTTRPKLTKTPPRLRPPQRRTTRPVSPTLPKITITVPKTVSPTLLRITTTAPETLSTPPPQPFLVLNGPKAQRSATLVFRLRHAGRVRFTVVEVFPHCRVVGSFTVRGHAGINRFRFNGRVHGKRLPAGTYQIGLRTSHGRLLRVTIAIFDSVVSPSAVVAARKRNVCGATTSFSSSPGFGLTGVEGRSAAAGSSSSSGSNHVLGVDVTALAPQNLAKEIGKSPFAIVALSLAVLLLGLAAVPKAATPGRRAADLLARRRSVMFLAGGVAFSASVIILALS